MKLIVYICKVIIYNMIVFRNNFGFADIIPSKNTSITEMVMEVSEMSLSFTLPRSISFEYGDFVNYQGKEFVFYNLPNVSKKSTGEYHYSVTLYERNGRELHNTKYLFCDQDSTTLKTYYTRGDFPLTATLSEFLSLVCRNLNRVKRMEDAEWDYKIQKGVDRSKMVNLTFSDQSCLESLNMICDAFSVEWKLDGRTIILGETIKEKTDIKFSYPKNLLSPLDLSYEQSSDFCTRLFVFGGERNISETTEATTRLKMPGDKDYISLKGSYGKPIIEKSVVFEEVYPRRNSVVQDVVVDSNGYYKIIDRTIDFDLSNYLFDGMSAKIAFTSGYLVGYEFEISYNHAERSVEIIQQEINGYVCPNSAMCPRIGDSYVFLDIKMPKEYKDRAQKELKEKAIEYFKNKCVVAVETSISVRPSWIFQNNINIKPYQEFTLIDMVLNINEVLRATSVVYYPFDDSTYGKKVNIDLANFLRKGRIKILDGKINTTRQKTYNYYKTIKSQVSTTNIITNNVGEDLTWEIG